MLAFFMKKEHEQKAELLVNQDILVPKNRVLLIDLDGTLIDEDYQITNDQIFPAIDDIQKRGWLVGLSSDTPLDPLRVWKSRFGMNGDIIAERGCILEIDGYTFDLRSDIELFEESLSQMKDIFTKAGAIVWSGDTVEFIRNNERLGEPGDIVILINGSRSQSLAFYVRKVDELGNLIIDSSLTEELVNFVRPVFPEIDDLNEDLNHQYGILILSRKSVVKRLGTQELMRVRNYAQVGMIGNSMTDFLGGDMAVHYAVANSSEQLKLNANYVSNQNVTEGVIEILKQLQRK